MFVSGILEPSVINYPQIPERQPLLSRVSAKVRHIGLGYPGAFSYKYPLPKGNHCCHGYQPKLDILVSGILEPSVASTLRFQKGHHCCHGYEAKLGVCPLHPGVFSCKYPLSKRQPLPPRVSAKVRRLSPVSWGLQVYPQLMINIYNVSNSLTLVTVVPSRKREAHFQSIDAYTGSYIGNHQGHTY